jgi:hypothetical protein
MNSLSQYLIDNALKTVVVVCETYREIEHLSDEILRKYIDLGGDVMSPHRFNYHLGLDNRLYFFTKDELYRKIRGMSIDLLMFSYRVDQMHVLNNVRANITRDGGIGILFPAPVSPRDEFPF